MACDLNLEKVTGNHVHCKSGISETLMLLQATNRKWHKTYLMVAIIASLFQRDFSGILARRTVPLHLQSFLSLSESDAEYVVFITSRNSEIDEFRNTFESVVIARWWFAFPPKTRIFFLFLLICNLYPLLLTSRWTIRYYSFIFFSTIRTTHQLQQSNY